MRKRQNCSWAPLLGVLLLLPLGPGLSAAEKLRFNRDIRPILSDKCFHCHGFDPKNRKAGLRLDTFEGAVADGGIVAGQRPDQEVGITRRCQTAHDVRQLAGGELARSAGAV